MVLERPDFVQACAQRDLGMILTLAKRWGGEGFSASHLARRCELTVSRVQDYISGRVRAQHIEIFERVADGLHIPSVMLNLGPRPWETSERSSDSAVAVHHPCTSTTNGDPSVLRRDFIKLGASVAGTTLAGDVPSMASATSGNRVGTTTIEALRANLAQLRGLDNYLGGADTFPMYEAEVERIAQLIEGGAFSDAAGRELLSVFAEHAQQAGWAAFDAGLHQKARQLFEHSFGVAQEAGSPDLAANALALRSYQLLSAGTISSELTDKSLSIAAQATHPAVKSLLFQRGAWTYAAVGQADQAAWALGQANDALAEPVHTAGPDWANWAHNATELEIMTGRCWAELHRPMRAIPALESAMSRYEDSHARDKALYLSWLAESYVDAGEIEHAAATLSRALDLSANVSSKRPRQRFNTVFDRLGPHRAASQVSELFARRALHPIQIGR